MIMPNVWQWLNDNASPLGLIFVVIPLVWSVWQYLSMKRQELRMERFRIYHDLIKQLVEREEADKPKMLDRQMAIFFEMRRFPEYFEPSLRIVEGLRDGWADNYGPEDKRNRLMAEMDATIEHIRKKFNKCTYGISQVVRGL